ncbi:unnamed protein product [Closterium sp. NIES-64]|nr:unnamed protein product [Closterium sp. NIES-64]
MTGLDLTWERLCSYASISFYAEFCTICATLASMVFLFFLIVIGDSDEVCGGVGSGGEGDEVCRTVERGERCGGWERGHATICATLASMLFLFFLIVIGDSYEEGRELSLFAAVVVAACVITLGILTLFKVTSRWRQAISVPLLSPRGPLSPPIPSSPRLSS